MYCTRCGARNEDNARFCIKCGANLVLVCPKCEARNPVDARHCGECGYNLTPGEHVQPRHPRVRYLLALTGVIIVVAAAGGGIWFLGRQLGWWKVAEATPSPQPTAMLTSPPGETVTSTTNITVTLPPPLVNVTFPTQPMTYPPEWPADLRYPDLFSLVEATSGTLAEGVQGWAAKLRYKGDPASAADLLSSFFTSKGWQVVERTELDSGSFLILIQQEGKRNSGVAVIDPDVGEPGSTRVVVTVFP